MDYEPQEWGPSAWTFLHTVSFAYPDDPDEATRHSTRRFFETLQHVLPCANCREHYRDRFITAALRDPFQSRDALTRWLVALHNDVNASHGKAAVAYEVVQATYSGTELLCGAVAPENVPPAAPRKSKMPLLGNAPRKPSSPYFGFIVTIAVLIVILLLVCVLVALQCKRIGVALFRR